MPRTCLEITSAGQPCRARPLKDSDRCFLHDPEHREAAGEARRVGGLRRRREGAVKVAFDLDGLDSAEGLRRFLEIAATDALSAEDGISRVRAMTYIVQTGIRLLEAADLEARVRALESEREMRAGHFNV